jgi:hypothetical protein
MAARTYLPTLYRILIALCNFITKHRTRILQVLGEEHTTAVDAVVTACTVLTDIIAPFVQVEPGVPA